MTTPGVVADWRRLPTFLEQELAGAKIDDVEPSSRVANRQARGWFIEQDGTRIRLSIWVQSRTLSPDSYSLGGEPVASAVLPQAWHDRTQPSLAWLFANVFVLRELESSQNEPDLAAADWTKVMPLVDTLKKFFVQHEVRDLEAHVPRLRLLSPIPARAQVGTELRIPFSVDQCRPDELEPTRVLGMASPARDPRRVPLRAVIQGRIGTDAAVELVADTRNVNRFVTLCIYELGLRSALLVEVSGLRHSSAPIHVSAKVVHAASVRSGIITRVDERHRQLRVDLANEESSDDSGVRPEQVRPTGIFMFDDADWEIAPGAESNAILHDDAAAAYLRSLDVRMHPPFSEHRR